MAWKKQYTPEEQAAYQAKKKADMEDIFKRIDEGVQQVFTSDKYKEYLKFMSKFTDYSARNTILIALQKPDATLVAAYGKWKQMGRQVNRGETGIEILAPIKVKTNMIMEYERPVIDEFGNKQYNEDGTEKTEILEKPVTDIRFKKVYVFDVSQTNGKELPDPVQELHGEIDSDRRDAIFKALQRATGIEIKFADIPGGAKGFYSPSDDEIVVQSGMSDAQTLKTAFHEAAHKLLHDPELEIATAHSARNEKEVQAESTAFIVAERLGLDTSEYSFPYIASWSDGKQLAQLTDVLDDIQSAAKNLTNAIESELLKLQKRDLTMEEMLADTDLTNLQKAEILIDDCLTRNVVFSKQAEQEIFQCAEENEDIAETVRLIADLELTYWQFPTPETQAPDVPAEEYYAAMNFDTPNYRNIEEQQMNRNPNIIGNTPYAELGDKSQLAYYSGLKPRHAENIAKQLEADGVRFSGLKKGYSVTITVNKADIPRYEAAVEKVKASYSQTKPQNAAAYFDTSQRNVPPPEIPEQKLPESFKEVPIITRSYLEAKQNGQLEVLRSSIMASKACRDFIDQNLYDAYENRNLKGFVQELEQRFGLERTMYTLAATIQLKDQDGRFTPDVKKQAARFEYDSDNMRLKFLTEQHPVRLNHLYETLIDRTKELAQTAPKPELPRLPDHLADQFLLSTERVSVRDDYRGIPETSYYKSSANEYFVEGIGWLDNDAYDLEHKMSGLSEPYFYRKVTKINAACVDAEGRVSDIDMTKQDYELLTEKTYAPENQQALEMAKAKLAEYMDEAGIEPKPTEQYAVRQTNNQRYAICTISADGLVTAVKPDIATVGEAKKALLELFAQRKATIRCELVHPQVLDEKSFELYRDQSRELPDVVYRIQLSQKQDSPDTHYVQQYIKNADETYKVGEVIARGDFFSCNEALASALAKPPVIAEEKAIDEVSKPDFAIYQLKDGDETRDFRFESMERLLKHGGKPDIANYDLVYEGRMADVTDHPDLRMQLEAVFYKFNMERPEDFTGHSLSVSDVVAVKDQAFYVDSFGFKPLPDFLKQELTEHKFLEALPGRLQAIAEKKVNPLEDNLMKISAEAAQLQISPAIMRKAADWVNDERIERMAEAYADRFGMGRATDGMEKQKPKKPKL